MSQLTDVTPKETATDYYFEMLKERDKAHANEVKLLQLQAAVRMFCHQFEMCALIAQGTTNFLQIQMDSEYYKHMKSLIQPIPTREEVESTETI